MKEDCNEENVTHPDMSCSRRILPCTSLPEDIGIGRGRLRSLGGVEDWCGARDWLAACCAPIPAPPVGLVVLLVFGFILELLLLELLPTVEPRRESRALCLSAGGCCAPPEATEDPEPCVIEDSGVAGAELLCCCCCCCCWMDCCCWVRKGFMLAVVAGGVTLESDAAEVGRVVVDADADWTGFMVRKRESRDFGGDGGAGSR